MIEFITQRNGDEMLVIDGRRIGYVRKLVLWSVDKTVYVAYYTSDYAKPEKVGEFMTDKEAFYAIVKARSMDYRHKMRRLTPTN